MKHPLVVAVTGASGVVYAIRLIEVLTQSGHDVHLVISPSGQLVIKEELDLTVDLEDFDISSLQLDADRGGTGPPAAGDITYHHYKNFMAPIASGSYLTSGMVICPCSGSTTSAVVSGASINLIHRAADVHLKERRRLILVPRETPLSLVQLENMQRACTLGAVVLPAMPGWYHGVRSTGDLVDFVVARILDQLEIEHTLMRRWGDGDQGTARK